MNKIINSKIKFNALITTLFISIYSTSSHSAELFVGVSAQQTEMWVWDKNTTADYAEMNSAVIMTPALSIKAYENYFSEKSSWGSFLEFGTGFYIVNRQNLNIGDQSIFSIVSPGEDLGTMLSGQYWHLTPTLFYNFGNKGIDWSTKAGIGIGLGYLSVSGDIVMTEKAGQPTESIDSDGYDISIGLFLEVSKNNWVMQFKSFSPSANIGNNSFNLALNSLVIGKRFEF